MDVEDKPSIPQQQVEIEYVVVNPFEDTGEEGTEDVLAEMKQIFAAFSLPTENAAQGEEGGDQAAEAAPKEEKLSKKKRKMQRRLPIAVLKSLVERPDLVEIHDTCAANPFLLMHLKAHRNSVPVPRHWSQKRKYLQGKRGIEKPPFELPDFIKGTGIMEIRNAALEKDAHKALKQKARERLNPTMGKLDIDYQILHDAFFKNQTKPKLTTFGDVYYEGKEYEVEMLEKRPGAISQKLREALGMSEYAAPPWLHNMQRVGPPPSYPHLKIPGLNAPLPVGAEYGYHPGGWGRPPPEYPEAMRNPYEAQSHAIERNFQHWGAVTIEERESSGEEEEVMDEDDDESGIKPEPPSDDDEIMDGSGIETPVTGFETPTNLEGALRKRKKDKPQSEGELFKVLEEQQTSVSASELYGSDHRYVVPKPPPPNFSAGEDKLDAVAELLKGGEKDVTAKDSKKRKHDGNEKPNKPRKKSKKTSEFKF